MRQTIRHRLIATLALLAAYPNLATATSVTQDPPVAMETMQMSSSDLRPTITAELALKRLLALIRTGKPVADFTPEWVGEMMGVPIVWAKNGSKRYGFGAPVTPRWMIGFGVDVSRIAIGEKPRFDLTFNPIPPSANPEMTDICQLDFDHFTAELEAMGYIRQPYYDSSPPPFMDEPRLSHGRLMYEAFSGDGPCIEVYPQGQSNAKANHNCVQMLFIQ